MKTRLYATAVVLLLLPALMIAAGPSGLARWASLGGDLRRSGCSSDAGPASGCISWQRGTGGPVVGSITVSADGGAYVPWEDGKLYAVDPNGMTRWVLDVNTPLESAASIGGDGTLYVGGRNGMLYAVDPDGSSRWSFETGGAIYSSPAVAPTGQIYVGSANGTLYALGSDGAELWRFTTDGPGQLPAGSIFASPAIGIDGTVYIGGLYDPNLYALNPEDGTIKWVCHFAVADHEGGWPFASPVVGPDGTIHQLLLYDPNLYAIEPQTGAVLWSTDLLDLAGLGTLPVPVDSQADGWSEPVVGPDGTIYVSLDDSYLRAVNPDGTIKWATWLSDVGGFTLTVDKDGRVYAAGDDGYVHAVGSDGIEITRLEVGGWPAWPIIAGAGLLIVADSRDYSSLNAEATNLIQAISAQCPPGAVSVSKTPQTPPPPQELPPPVTSSP